MNWRDGVLGMIAGGLLVVMVAALGGQVWRHVTRDDRPSAFSLGIGAGVSLPATCDLPWSKVQLDMQVLGGRIIAVDNVTEFLERYNAEPPISTYTGKPHVIRLVDILLVALVDESNCVESMMKVDPKKLDYLLRGNHT